MIGINKVKVLYHNVENGIKNLVKWLPVIWKDRDYDDAYLMYILHFKLSEMSKLHRNHSNAIDANKTADELDAAAKLAKRIADNDYTDEAFGDKRCLLDKAVFDFVKTSSGYSKLEITGLTQEEYSEKKRLTKLESEMLERDIHLLFNMMKRDLRKWWD